MSPILLWSVVALVATAVVWWGSTLLERASERLAAYYRLPDIVQGAVVVAVGSSFPELSTTVISTLVHGEFELGVAAIVGSALFNILIIPAVSGLVSQRQLASNRDLVYKEAQFYMIAVAVLTLTFAFAAIYHPLPDDSGAIRGEMTRWLALMPLALYGLYVFVQYQDTLDHRTEVDPRAIRPGREWARLGLSLVSHRDRRGGAGARRRSASASCSTRRPSSGALRWSRRAPRFPMPSSPCAPPAPAGA
ncbi:MAG: sodium/calcium exchanger protein [Arhodomonas sp.]|nr:sodium/calcium exchanger protein [Arhodomonas sp.]